MSRPVQVLAAAAFVVLVAIAVWAFVSDEGADRAGEPPAQDHRAPETRSEPDPPAVALGAVDDDLRREAAAAPELAPPPVADASTALLRVRAISATTRQPLPRARLTVFPTDPSIETTSVDVDGSHGSLAQSPVTDADGRAEFELPPDVPFVLWIRGQDAGAESGPRDVAALRAGEQREMLVELATGDDLRFVGRVVKKSDGSPVSEAHVTVRVGELGDELAAAWSDSGGLFELDLPSWRHPYLRVEAKGFGPALVTPTKDHDSAERAFVIELAAGATLDARVLHASGEPMEGATVRLTASSFQMHCASGNALSNLTAVLDELREAATGSDGSCALADLGPGIEYRLEILRAGVSLRREGDPLVLDPGQVLQREWRIGAGGTFLGIAVDQSDAPVAGLEIWLAPASSDEPRFFQPHESTATAGTTTSDAQGRFEFRDVPAGAWWIGPGAGSIFAPAAGDVATQATRFEMLGAESQEIRLRVHRGLYVRGRVVDPEGQPQPEIPVLAWGDASRLSVNSDADGRFAIGPLVPGSIRLVAIGHGNLAASDPVDAEAGREDVELRLRPGGAIRGRVVDAGTGAGCQAELRLALETPGRGWNLDGTGWTNREDGAFETDGLEPGLYGLSAQTKDGRFGILRGIVVAAGAETGDLVVAVAPGGRLRLLYEGERAKVRCVVRHEGVPIGWGWEMERGRPIEELVPAGALDLRLMPGFEGELETRSVVLGVGETREVVFRD